LFENASNPQDSTNQNTIYTEGGLKRLEGVCSEIVAKGDDATSGEIDFLNSALNEVESLQKGLVEVEGEMIVAYFCK
jgi:hypothetical protein